MKGIRHLLVGALILAVSLSLFYLLNFYLLGNVNGVISFVGLQVYLAWHRSKEEKE
jgi:hypothetical protein